MKYCIFLICTSLFLTVGCTKDKADPIIPTAPTATFHEVQSSDFQFSPSSLSISVGDTVRWTNVSGVHNVDGDTSTYSSNPLSFGNPNNSVGQWTYTFVFNQAGTFQYECGIHGSSMPGVITVL